MINPIARSMMFIGYFILVLAIIAVILGDRSLYSPTFLLIIFSIVIAIVMILISIYIIKRSVYNY